MAKKRSEIKPGGVPEYIAKCPKEVQVQLKSIRAAIREVSKGAIETTSYFQMPGYSCGGEYEYNGMFVWFSYKKPYVRLHLLPPVIKEHKKELANFPTTAAIVSFSPDTKISMTLVKKLVKASLKAIKERSKSQ